MFKKFLRWFTIFALSFIIQGFGIANQGTAFFWLDCAGITFLLLISFLGAVFLPKSLIGKIGATFTVGFITILVFGITLFATWLATKIFDISFVVAYQIMTFGQCLCSNQNDTVKEK